MKTAAGIFLALVSVVLTSCGGGNSGNGNAVTPTPAPSPSGGTSTLSAIQMQRCPLGDFTTTAQLPDGVSGCMHGLISGVTALHGTDPCTVVYDGVNVSYKSQAFNMILSVDAQTKVHFQHSTTNGQHMLSDWRDHYDPATKAMNYFHLQYSQALDVALANTIIEVQAGSQRGECYAKL